MLVIISGKDTSTHAGIDADLRAVTEENIGYRTILTGTYISADKAFIETDRHFFRDQIDILFQDKKVTTVKIGALFSVYQVELLFSSIVEFRKSHPLKVVVDPVISPSAGGVFADEIDFIPQLRKLINISTISTPNIPEFRDIFGDVDIDPFFAKKFHQNATLLKGGHSKEKIDTFMMQDMRAYIKGPVYDREFRGTGCYLATKIALYLEKGFEIKDAVVCAIWSFNSAMQIAYDNNLVSLPDIKDNITPLFPLISYDTNYFDIKHSPRLVNGTNNKLYIVTETKKLFEILQNKEPSVIQLRLKGYSYFEVQKIIEDLNPKKSHEKSIRILNDYAELYSPDKFDGVHIGQEDLFRTDIEKLKTKNAILGISTHSLFELSVAINLKPSYIALGPIFQTICKNMIFKPQGYDNIRFWKTIIGKPPLVAIGGIRGDRYIQSIGHGADYVAIQSDITLDNDPSQKAESYTQLDQRV